MKISIAAVLLLTSALSAGAQEPTLLNPPAAEPSAVTAPPVAGMPSQGYAVGIHRLSAAPKIDGKLDDAVWQEGNLLTDFTQIEPVSGQPATQRTEVRMGYDAQNIYFGVRCYDKEPARIVASSRSPDAGLASDDTISVFLDTFHDRRNGFFFSLNPIGS